MKCPICGETTLSTSVSQGVEVGYCPKCRRIYLGDDETIGSGVDGESVHGIAKDFDNNDNCPNERRNKRLRLPKRKSSSCLDWAIETCCSVINFIGNIVSRL